MDQISGAIRWIKKNGFWLGCFIMSALMIGMWCFRVFTSIDTATADNVKKIEQKISTTRSIQQVSAEGVEGAAAHPNSQSEEGIRTEMSQTVDSIIEAWEKRVKDQERILKWPSDIIESPRFAATFSKYNPPELIPDTWLKGDGRLGALLKLYAKNIPKQMVVLTGDDLLRTRWNYDPERLEAEKVANAQTAVGGPAFGGGYEEEYDAQAYGDDETGRGGYPGGYTPGASEVPGVIVDKLTGELIDMNSYAVIWGETNQLLWQTKMTSFKGRDDNQLATNTPTPLQCYMLQQDLWLLEALFKIIREVNGDADANDISTIKRLDHVVFGRDVGGKLGVLTPFDPRLGAGVAPLPGADGEFEDDYLEEEEYDYGEDSDGYGGGFGEGAPLVSPVENRYVDSNFEPLDAEKVKTILSGTELPEEDLELIVSKRVPVRIAVRMKETEIANFMAACANSPFAFEIQQVRWNKHIPGEEIPLGGGQGANVPGFGGSYGGPGFGAGYGGGIGADLGPVLKSTPVEIRTNYDVNVEFYGIVKIYNPVRPKVLRAAAGLEEAVDPNDAASLVSPQPNQSRP